MFPFNDTKLFKQWLSINNLTHDEFLEWFENNPQNSSELMENTWIHYLLNDYKLSFGKDLGDDFHPFATFVGFIVEKATTEFENKLDEIGNFNTECINPLLFKRTFIKELVHSLVSIITPTLTLELNVARESNILIGNSSEARYQNFINLLSDTNYVLQIFCEYPVLLDRLIIKTEQNISELIEIYSRLTKDYHELNIHFGNLGGFNGFNSQKGDCHNNGRTVRICEFNNLKIVYKPRKMNADLAFQKFLIELNRVAGTSFKVYTCLDKADYGWAEYIKFNPCSSKESVNNYYINMGHYLMLLYLFNSADFHFENVVSDSENPMLIDLESIFHTVIDTGNCFSFKNHTVLDSEILPKKIQFANYKNLIDISVLGYCKDQMIQNSIGESTDSRRDDAVLESTKRKISQLDKSHSDKDKFDISTQQKIDLLCNGFKQLYSFFLENNSWLFENHHFKTLIQLNYRCILRNTNTYTTLLRGSYHPDFLRNTYDAKLYLHQKLWGASNHEAYTKDIINIEVEDIFRHNVPIFQFTPISNKMSSYNQVLESTKCESLNNTIHEINSNLSNQDLDLQIWHIHASMMTQKPTLENHGFILRMKNFNQELLKNYVTNISKNLKKISTDSSSSYSWKDYKYIDSGQCILSQQDDFELFNGQLGSLLYLNYYTHLFQDENVSNLNTYTINTIIDNFKGDSIKSIGGYIGYGGMLYALAKIYKLTSNKKILSILPNIKSCISKNIKEDSYYDVLYGSAGAILSLLSAYEVFKDKELISIAINCGEHLINNFKQQNNGGGWINSDGIDRPLGGFSHGASGIAFALARLSSVTKISNFLTYANAAIDYENSLFDTNSSNYKDLRSGIECSHDPVDMTAWCNGVVGIALSRIEILTNNWMPSRNDEFIIEIKRNVKKIIKNGLGKNQSLCHGDASALEYLFQVAKNYPEIFCKKKFDLLLESTISKIASSKQKNGVNFDIFSPGLMLGSLGLSYQCMRFKNPNIVGNLLLLN
jgi:type 2 lantibiotic biosynthesis protein LanM